MSDQVQAPAPAVQHDSLVQIKASLLAGITAAYATFISNARMLPVHQGIMQKAFGHLDDGLVWLEKAISVMEAVPLPPQAEAVADVAGEVIQAVDDVVEAAPAA